MNIVFKGTVAEVIKELRYMAFLYEKQSLKEILAVAA